MWACPKTAVALGISRCREPAQAWTQSHSEDIAGWHSPGALTAYRDHSHQNDKPRPGRHLHLLFPHKSNAFSSCPLGFPKQLKGEGASRPFRLFSQFLTYCSLIRRKHVLTYHSINTWGNLPVSQHDFPVSTRMQQTGTLRKV